VLACPLVDTRALPFDLGPRPSETVQKNRWSYPGPRNLRGRRPKKAELPGRRDFQNQEGSGRLDGKRLAPSTTGKRRCFRPPRSNGKSAPPQKPAAPGPRSPFRRTAGGQTHHPRPQPEARGAGAAHARSRSTPAVTCKPFSMWTRLSSGDLASLESAALPKKRQEYPHRAPNPSTQCRPRPCRTRAYYKDGLAPPKSRAHRPIRKTYPRPKRVTIGIYWQLLRMLGLDQPRMGTLREVQVWLEFLRATGGMRTTPLCALSGLASPYCPFTGRSDWDVDAC